MSESDIPSPIDFHKPEEAQKWADEAAVKRASRADFFAAFAAELNQCAQDSPRVLELGSGPGFLAESLLSQCAIREYVMLDFSDAMHAIAKSRLQRFESITHFVTRDLKAENWTEGLGVFDIVVTMQAAHEVRHKRHLKILYQAIHDLIKPGGCLLICDHYWASGSRKNPGLFLSHEEQPQVLQDAGFKNIRLVLDREEMTLYEANRAQV